MNKLYILIALGILPVFIFSVAHAFSPVPVATTVVSGFLSLGKLSSANSMLYAALIAMGLFVVFEVALERTQLSNGSIPISIVFALIVFFVLYSDSALLHFFVNVVMVMTLILIILGMLALVKSPRSIRIIGLVVALFLSYILFVNDSGLTNSIDSALHINLLQILPLILGVVTVFAIILFFVKGIRNSSNPNVKILFAFIIVLIVALLIPGFASFLFNPIIGVVLLIAVVLAVLMMRKLSRGHKVKLTKAGKAAVAERKAALKEQKKAEKIEEIKPQVLSSIKERKQANADALKDYRALISKKNLTPGEQLKVAQLKSQLANEAWKNVADRTKLTAAQYSKKELANNRNLQRLTGSLLRGQTLHDLRQDAKRNYRMSRAEKKALKAEQKGIDKKNVFTENMGNKESGDLFDMANAVNAGAMVDAKGRPVIPKSEKEARRLYKDMLSKERRNNDIAKLLKQRQDYQSPDLFLSNSTRTKLIKRLDKKLNKLTGNKIVPKSLQEINADKLRKEQIQQARQELSEDDRIAQAQLKDARRQAAWDQQDASAERHMKSTRDFIRGLKEQFAREAHEDKVREQQENIASMNEEEKKAALQKFLDQNRQGTEITERAEREIGESQKRITANNADKGDFAKALNFWDREVASAERENDTRAKEYADKKKRELIEELQKQRSNEDIQKQVAKELGKQPPGEPIKKQNFFERFSSKASRNGTGRRDVIQMGEKNEEASNQAGIDIYNAKRITGAFSTQEERELQSLLENAYKTAKDNKHINDPRPQEQITKIKEAQKYIVGNPDKAAARKALEDLKKRL